MDFNIQHGGVPRRSRFFYRGFHFDFGPLRVALCSNDTLRLHTRLAVPQQGVCGPISAGPLSRSHNHTRPMRRPPAGRHRKHDSHSKPSRQTIRHTEVYRKLRIAKNSYFLSSPISCQRRTFRWRPASPVSRVAVRTGPAAEAFRDGQVEAALFYCLILQKSAASRFANLLNCSKDSSFLCRTLSNSSAISMSRCTASLMTPHSGRPLSAERTFSRLWRYLNGLGACRGDL